MKIPEFFSTRGRFPVVILLASLCTSGCAMLPMVAMNSGAAGAGMQALGSAAGAVGMDALGDRFGDAMDYMDGGEPIADVTYWTRPAPLENIVEQTLQDTASSSLVAFEYSASYEADEDLYVLSTSSGSELTVVVRQDPAYDDLHATQMVVEMETDGDASQQSETLAFVEAIQAIDNRTERQGIEEIRGEFNYVDGLRA